MSDEKRRLNVASTGLVGTESGFLDAHFEACRPEYEAMIRSVGLQSGWRVLDAACGAGGFLAEISSLVGSSGSVSAFDLAPDTVSVVDKRIASEEFGCRVDVQVASLLEIPFPKDEFDAVWCANSLEYLNDEELMRALAEFDRVLKPGGIISMKDADGGLFLFSPGDPTLLPRAWAAATEVSQNFRGCLRTRSMRRWFERAGFVDIWQRGTLSEMWAPLTPVQHQYIGGQLTQIGALAESAGGPESDMVFWRAQRDPNSAEALVNHPELFWCEGAFVTVGRRSA
jgi:ubiquinone/menaquinone biosynthesis C-methylase UbiE